MALGASTFDLAGGAVSDLFAASAAGSRIQGMGLQSQSYDYTIAGLGLKSQGLGIQAAGLDRAAGFADTEAYLVGENTALQMMQLKRKEELSQGSTQAAVAGLGFANSGSAIDIMLDNARMASLEQQVAEKNGTIAQAGYAEQAASYRTQSSIARLEQQQVGIAQDSARAAQAASYAAMDAAKKEQKGRQITGIIKGAAAIGSLFVTGGASAPLVAGMFAAEAAGGK